MVGTSFFGLLLIGVLALTRQPINTSFPWHRPLIGFLYTLICLAGIAAVFFPTLCSTLVTSRKKATRHSLAINAFESTSVGSLIGAHHPDCQNFSAHVFRNNNRRTCAACLGLLLGGLVSLAGAWLFFFGEWSLSGSGLQGILLGMVGVGLGLLQYKIRRNIIRLMANSLFVIGTLFLLVGIDEITQSVLADLFVIGLALFWLFTRISLSQWNNWRICHNCPVDSCRHRILDNNGIGLLSTA